MSTFIGVNLGWFGKPSGLAAIAFDGPVLRLKGIARIEAVDPILSWIEFQTGGGSAMIAVDAPLVIRNQKSIRGAEWELNRDFRRFHAGCHAANLGRPFSKNVLAFSESLRLLGFGHGAAIVPQQQGRFQIEVHPHAASVKLFELDRIVKYKRGTRAQKAVELGRFRRLMISRLEGLEPSLSLRAPSLRLPSLPRMGNLKPAEDQIDAVLCAYIAAHWWFWGRKRNTVYGTELDGYIVVPDPGLQPVHGIAAHR